MKAVEKKVKKIMTDLLVSSLGQPLAGIIVNTIFDDVLEEIRHTMGEISEDDVNAESVKSGMNKVLERLLYDL